MKLRKNLVIVIALFLILLLGSYVNDWATPSLILFSPEKNSIDQYQRTPLQWKFSHDMNHASVEDSIVISPNVDGQYSWDENILTFFPGEDWEMGEIVKMEMNLGASTKLGFKILSPYTYQFTVRETLLAYLFEDNGNVDIYALGIFGALPRKLTTNGFVTAYSVSGDGENLYFSAENNQHGSDVFEFQRFTQETKLLFSCFEALCENPSISPEGKYLAFTKANDKGIPELWIYEFSFETNTKIGTNNEEIRYLEWTSSGYLSFYNVGTQNYLLISPDGKIISKFANPSGEKGSWSPDGATFVAPFLFTKESDILLGPTGEAAFDEVDFEELSKVSLLSSHLFSYQQGKEPVNFSKELWVEDMHPSFSNSGRWLAFARRFNDQFRWIPGRQLVIMPAQGGLVSNLSNDEQYKYSDFVWHPTDDIIAAMRFNALVFTELPEIWMFDLTGHSTRLIIGGYNPQWIP